MCIRDSDNLASFALQREGAAAQFMSLQRGREFAEQRTRRVGGAVSYTHLETAGTDNPDVAHEQRPGAGAYLTRDARASISMGLVSVATTAGWKSLALLGYVAIYTYVAPWHLSATHWYRCV